MLFRAFILAYLFISGASAIAGPIYILPQRIEQAGPQNVRITFSYFTEAKVIAEGRPRFESDDKEFTTEIRQLIGKIVQHASLMGETLVHSDELEDFGLFVANYAIKTLNHTLEILDFEDRVVLAMEFEIDQNFNRAFLRLEMDGGVTDSHIIDLVEQKRIFKLWFSPVKSLNRILYRKARLKE